MRGRILIIAALSLSAACLSVSQANAFARMNCFIEPSIQHSTQDLIAVFTRSIVTPPAFAAGSMERQPEHLACTYYGRGLLYQLEGDNERAIADFTRAIGWMSTYGDAYAARGDAEEDSGQHEAAMRDYALAAANPSHIPAALTERCWVRVLRGRPLPLALQDCNEALRTEPVDADPRASVSALTARGFVYLRMANYPAAIADADASLKLEPRDASALLVRGIARLRSGDTAGGNADLAAANALTDRVAESFAMFGVKP
jgi:tetratricopeptide (TPR) repeat protein